ncbi:MAG: hypothetical protein QNJ32_17100 [Xenococcaceae cyanobacterium MO_167.B27]|nr:hypothetical protein [Xenococcaceae cyanobacterium MO_167.B27]
MNIIFTSGTDKLDFRGIVDEIEAYISPSTVTDAIAEGYITQEFFSGEGTMVRVDFDASGSLNPKDVVFLQNLTGTIPDTDFIPHPTKLW